MSITSFPKSKIEILLLENIHESAVAEFKAAGYNNITRLHRSMSKKELAKELTKTHILGIRSKTHIDQDTISLAHKLLAIGCFCIGINQVDRINCAINGISVFNSPYSNTRSVAELIIGEAILLKRGVIHKNKAAHDGIWLKDAINSYELRGKTIGIIGYGHIGSQVSVLAESLGMNVLYYDIVPKLPLGNARACRSMKEVLEQADVLTFHVPDEANTYHLLNKKNILSVKKDAVILNLSRGNVVDLLAISFALDQNLILGYGADVFPTEPDSTEPFECILRNRHNVLLTPHIGGSTVEAQERTGIEVAHKLIQFLDAGCTMGSHSIPELSLPTQSGTHRILHIHHNVPGVLSAITSVLSAHNINIAGQYLKTNEKIGYAVVDIEKTKNKEIINALEKISHTIKMRILY